MKEESWVRRLTEQLPGWYVYLSPERGKRWRAVPAPVGTTLDQAQGMPRHVYADTPARLREACRQRYAWHEYCETCGTLARECGHRQPEREKTHP